MISCGNSLCPVYGGKCVQMSCLQLSTMDDSMAPRDSFIKRCVKMALHISFAFSKPLTLKNDGHQNNSTCISRIYVVRHHAP